MILQAAKLPKYIININVRYTPHLIRFRLRLYHKMNDNIEYIKAIVIIFSPRQGNVYDELHLFTLIYIIYSRVNKFSALLIWVHCNIILHNGSFLVNLISFMP